MISALTPTDIEKVESTVTALCEKWEELEKEGSNFLKNICEARVQMIHSGGSLFGLEKLDTQIDIRSAFTDKIKQNQSIGHKSLSTILEMMAVTLTSYNDNIEELLSSFIPTKSILHLHHVSSQIIEKFINDFATKETIANYIASPDAPQDADRLQIQMYAFTCQGFILNSIEALKESIRATAAML